MTGSLIETQFAALQAMHPSSTKSAMGDGTELVTVPVVMLPPGWNQSQTGISFLIPVGFPMARPDCFWADATLRLANGGMPHASGVSQVPSIAEPRLWFSWHLGSWNPVTDTFLTYVRVIHNRFAQGN